MPTQFPNKEAFLPNPDLLICKFQLIDLLPTSIFIKIEIEMKFIPRRIRNEIVKLI